MGKLIRLELFNFKSYKGHHTLLFGDSYFTSIIGPNGSGKSNSMDAISFVLGIKSSQLRSSQLKDLVYRGRVLKTSKINDDGSAAAPEANGHTNGVTNGDEDEFAHRSSRNDPKTAWVMAVYEDDAGDEHRWKRAITSQGSSEYRINDRVVNATQYNAALEKENILIKARNFLVFQGDVEAIAAQSPQDLTRLIEQISGSLECKADYERLQIDAERSAENQADQLQKRRAINSQIKQYQEQKKEADNFQNKTEERDAAIVTQILWKLFHLQRGMDESSAKIQEHQDNLKDIRRSAEAWEKKLETARKEQAAATRDVTKIEKAIKSKERRIEELNNDLVPAGEKVKHTLLRINNGRKQIDDKGKEREKYVQERQRLKKELATIEKAQDRFEKDYRDKMKQQGKELSDADRKEYTALRAQVRARTSPDQAKLDGLQRQQKTDEVTVQSMKSKVDAMSAAVEKLEDELSTTKEQKAQRDATFKELSANIDKKKEEYSQMQSERVRLNQRQTELREKIEDITKKISEADDGRRQNARDATRRDIVASLRRDFPGVRGRIGDLCKPKQKKFDQAIIVALGRDFDALVVDTEKTGLECVQYLKEKRAAPMTFIPLDNIKVNAASTVIKGVSGARLTIETIDFDSSLERAMAYACGDSVVCDSLDIAKHICYERKIQVKAVTLDGFVIHKAGLLTGGRVHDNKGKRRFEENDLENLRRMLDKYVDELHGQPKADRRTSGEEEAQDEIANIQHRLSAVKGELAALDRNLASKKKELDNEKKQLRQFEPKYAEKKAEFETTSRSLKEFEDAVAKVEDQVFTKFCARLGYKDIRVYEAQQGTMEQEVANERNKFDMQKKKIESSLSWNEDMAADLHSRIQKLEAVAKGSDRDLKTYQKDVTRIEGDISDQQDEVAALNDQLDEAQEEREQKSQKVSEAKSEFQKRARDIEVIQKEIIGEETTVQKNSASKFALLKRCKLEQTQLPLLTGSLDDLPSEDNLLQQDPDAMDVDGGDVADYLMDAALDDHGIEIEFDGLEDDLKESDDPSIEERLQDKIASLTAELEKLNPNMRAMEKLESVEATLRATEKDFEDSRVAARRAREAFSEIKTKRFELFNRAFGHIQEQIKHVYKELTRSEAYPLGGQAYLDVEEDTETPYLSGIKYHAMPPLKRFRDMEHLSGGEKTMAALALLFAIHSYHPSPFFVLDEVDAALDNANVDKIKKYIRDHCGPSMQFIIISLKAGLFQDSQSLIGVYRDQDVNSSRTLTLDLRKYA